MKPTLMRPALRQLRNFHNLTGVEIGVYLGDYALIYLRELDIEKVYLIDPYIKYEGYDYEHTPEILKDAEEEAHEKLKVYEDKIIWINTKSAEAVGIFDDESLDFVYIDGNHQCRFVLEEMILYYPKIKKGGLFSGHDYRRIQPDQVFGAVNEFCKNNDLKLNRGQSDWWIWK